MSNVNIVLNVYKENIDWILNPLCNIFDFHIYNKFNQCCKYSTNNINQESLPNVGRESHTYLKFIIDNYENGLKPVNVFLQAHPDKIHINEVYSRIIKYLDGFLPLSNHWMVFDKNGFPDHNVYNRLPIGEMWKELFEGDCPRMFGCYANAQFVVSKELIQSNSLNFYKHCIKYLEKSDLSPEYYVFERFWHLIFDTDVIKKEFN